MWTSLLSHQRFSLLFAIFVVALDAGARAQSLPQCAVAGQYCQNHWDCCSNSCMTYLYRCLGGAPSYPEIYIEPLDTLVETSLDDLLELNFGGNFGRLPAYEAPQRPQLQNRFGIVENGAPREQKPATAVSSTQNVPADLLSIVLQSNHQQGEKRPQQQHQQQKEVAQRESAPNTLETLPAAPVTAGERVSVSESGPMPSVPPCKSIGEKCYKNEECCTQRCHGFLHQCVT